MAAATSLPEIATDIFAVRQGHRNLAVGDLFGSSMANMLILAGADLATRQHRLLARVALAQVVVGLLAVLLTALAIAGMLSSLPLSIWGVGWTPLLIAASYLWVMRRLHQRDDPAGGAARRVLRPAALWKEDGLAAAAIGFLIASLAILAAAPHLASSGAALAAQLGVGKGFAGMVLLGITTSLPELSVTAAAIRAGSIDLAVGNLLGSNSFNMVVFLALDIADGPSLLMSGLPPSLALGALFAIVMMAQTMLDIFNRNERRIGPVEPDALIRALIYFFGMFLVYRAGGG